MERADLSLALRLWRSAERGARSEAVVLVSESRPERFMAAFADAVAGNGEVFLCDSAWGASERAQLDALLTAPRFPLPAGCPARGWLMVPTGGTSGQVKFARHDAETVSAAVRGFAQHFALPQVNAVGVLPLHHVSGLMAWMRCGLTGGEYRPLDWKAVEAGELPVLPAKADGWTISLVPTQLARLLGKERAVVWLREFRMILLGGGPAWPELLEQAAAQRLPLSLGFGLTESAAMVSALQPSDFLAGRRSCGTTLPHAQVILAAGGTISIGGASLFRGYYPHWRERADFTTEDSGYLDEHGHLHITGRRDAVIISGGEKVDPAEVEAMLRGSGEFADVVVLGMPDAEWGQMIVAAHPELPTPDLVKVAAAMGRLLAPAKRPKRFVPVKDWPANSLGKVNRGELGRVVRQLLLAGA